MLSAYIRFNSAANLSYSEIVETTCLLFPSTYYSNVYGVIYVLIKRRGNYFKLEFSVYFSTHKNTNESTVGSKITIFPTVLSVMSERIYIIITY